METQAIEKSDAVGGPGIMALAKQLSTSGLIPRALQGKPADVLVVLLTGKELGLGPMQSMRGIHVIDGKGVLDATLIAGLVMKARDVCEWFRLVESTDTVATYEAKRAGHPAPVTLSFTIEQAKNAGLTGKQNWRNFPAAMLRARACTALARALFPDLTAGLYDPDELGQEKHHVEAPAPVPAKRQERAAVDAEVVEAKPLDPYRNRKGVVHPAGSSAHVAPEVLEAEQAKLDDEKRALLAAGDEKLRQFDAKQTLVAKHLGSEPTASERLHIALQESPDVAHLERVGNGIAEAKKAGSVTADEVRELRKAYVKRYGELTPRTAKPAAAAEPGSAG